MPRCPANFCTNYDRVDLCMCRGGNDGIPKRDYIVTLNKTIPLN